MSVCSRPCVCRKNASAPVPTSWPRVKRRARRLLLLGAWRAARLMPDGRRQILTILIPGDFFDLHGFLLQASDHSVAAIGPTRIAAIGREAVIDIIANHPRIGAALWWSAIQEDAMLRERIVRSDAAPHAGVSPISSASSFGGNGRSAWPRITRSTCPLRKRIWPTC